MEEVSKLLADMWQNQLIEAKMSSSSPFPVLDNRPIDKWKVTELKEELKRRGLTTRGLKEELVRRLAEAIRVEQEESERLKSSASIAEKPNQEAQMFPVTGGNFTPDRMQTTPVAPVEAAFSTETTPLAAERTPEPTQSKTTTEASAAVETTPPPVFLEPAVPFASDKDEKADDVRGDLAGPDSSVVPHDAAAVEEAPSSEQIIHNSENKEPFSGLDDGDSKALPTEAVLENSAMYNQVSEVIPVTGFEPNMIRNDKKGKGKLIDGETFQMDSLNYQFQSQCKTQQSGRGTMRLQQDLMHQRGRGTMRPLQGQMHQSGRGVHMRGRQQGIQMHQSGRGTMRLQQGLMHQRGRGTMRPQQGQMHQSGRGVQMHQSGRGIQMHQSRRGVQRETVTPQTSFSGIAMAGPEEDIQETPNIKESYAAQIRAAMDPCLTKMDDIGPSEYSMKDIKDNAVKHFLHLLDTASDQELLALKKIQTVMKEKVVESRPITKIESLKDKGISYKQFADILIKNIEREMEKDDPERMQQKNLKN